MSENLAPHPPHLYVPPCLVPLSNCCAGWSPTKNLSLSVILMPLVVVVGGSDRVRMQSSRSCSKEIWSSVDGFLLYSGLYVNCSLSLLLSTEHCWVVNSVCLAPVSYRNMLGRANDKQRRASNTDSIYTRTPCGEQQQQQGTTTATTTSELHFRAPPPLQSYKVPRYKAFWATRCHYFWPHHFWPHHSWSHHSWATATRPHHSWATATRPHHFWAHHPHHFWATGHHHHFWATRPHHFWATRHHHHFWATNFWTSELQGTTTPELQGHTTSELQGHTTSELQDHTTSELQHMQYLQLGLPEEEHTPQTPQTQLKTKHGRIITRLLGTVIEYDTLRHSLFKKTLLAQLQRDIQIEKTNLLSRIYFNTHHSLPD